MISSLAKAAAALAAALLLSVVSVPPASAGGVACGDNLCSVGEDCGNCPQDCPGCCGNGDPEVGEACDDGNFSNGDGCTTSCLIENGYPCNQSGPASLTGDSSCESGTCDPTQGANGTCEDPNVCGNGHLEAGEGCDDGGESSLDGCSSGCLIENGNACNQDSNGSIGSESCVSTLCDTTEGGAGICESPFTCGNSVLEYPEGCDDGNVNSGDGCDSSCLVEAESPCNNDENGVTGDASCASGICNEAAEPVPMCQFANQCGNTVCEPTNDETCESCPADCPVCATTTTSTTSTTTLPDATTTTTLPEATTTTTLPDATTTTTLPEATTTTTVPEATTTTTLLDLGACCTGSGCTDDTTSDYCTVELQGTWQDAGSSCTDPGICAVCGNGCVEFGEDCDDEGTDPGDGCDANCQEEQCFQCSIILGGFTTSTDVVPVACIPSTCLPIQGCGICGNGTVDNGEQCDDGGTAAGDCCGTTCQFEAVGSPCPDDLNFCNGPESCNGSGLCVNGPDPTCDNFDSACAEGACDTKLNACFADTSGKDGDPCAAPDACVVGGSGTCQDGTCTGTGTTLSPTCRWIIVGGYPSADVRVRSGRGSTMDADQCGDTAKSAGITTGSIVVTATTDEGIRFYGHPEVEDDIVTGGATVRANLYTTIPGTLEKTIGTNLQIAKLPTGEVNTKGTHPLVDVCGDDQTLIANARATLDAMGNPAIEEGDPNKGLKVAVGGGYLIDVTGDGVAVVDMNGLKVGHGASLTLKGNPTDVIMIRVNEGRLKFGYHSSLILDGLKPENVLFYAEGSRCRISPSVVGAGTVYCAEAGRFIVGVGVNWSGTFLGAKREVQVRLGAQLTHVPFTGF